MFCFQPSSSTRKDVPQPFAHADSDESRFAIFRHFGGQMFPQEPKSFAILGSTGFLGPYLVASLLGTYPDAEIFCLNRSPEAAPRTTTALQQTTRTSSLFLSQLHFLVADITQPYFGLQDKDYEMLELQVTEFIFNAWDTDWNKHFKDFKPLIQGVRNTIEFCTHACLQPRITFISSTCAVGNWPKIHPEEPVIPEQVVWDTRSAMPHGYGESKLLAEHLLAKANEATSIPVNIVRISQIAGPSNPSLGRWPRQNWIHCILSISSLLNSFPKHVQPLNWMPVDVVADGVMNATMTRPSHHSLQVFNFVHPNPVPWRMLYTTLCESFGFRADEISFTEWLGRLDLEAAWGGREHDMDFETSRASSVLRKIGPITPSLLRGWLYGWSLPGQRSRAKI